jgi:hypothetical protein
VHRSVASLARRLAAAGATAVVTLTLFNGVQPSLRRPHHPGPGTVRDLAVPLAPAGAGPAAPRAASGPAGRERQAGPLAAQLSPPLAVGTSRLVGLSLPAGPAAGERHVLVRTRAGANWSAWRELEADSADGPDPGSPEDHPGRVFTDPLWLDAGTTQVQVQVPPGAPAAGGVQAHLVTPDMTPTPGTEPPRPGEATAMTTRPSIISRARWGADESLRRAAPSYSATVKAAYVHHTVQSNGYSPSESAALVRADYVYHVRSRGWNDIGYNFLVDRYGQVFEGRYGGITRPVLGAHASGFNTDTTGVALLGTFSTSRPTAAMLGALERLLAWKLDLTRVDPLGLTALTSAGGSTSRFPAGTRVVAHTILGHRGTSYTDCPGGAAYALLPSIRSAVSRIGRPKVYGGSASAASVSPETGGSVGVHARFSQTVNWRVSVTGSNGGLVRSWTGLGGEATVHWDGRDTAGGLAPAGWATVTVAAAAGGATARPASSRVFVRRSVPLGGTTTGGYDAGRWTLSNYNADQLGGGTYTRFGYGGHHDIPIWGDWDGDGTQSAGLIRGNVFYLRNGTSGPHDVPLFSYGRPGDHFVVGDWDGNGTWTPAVVRGGTWYLRSQNTTGPHDMASFRFGRTGDRFLAGDWDGDGRFDPGVHRSGTFWLRTSLSTGPAELHVRFGRTDDRPFVGDWNGNGTWTPGLLRAGVKWYLKDSFSGSTARVGFAKQTAGTPVVGDWDSQP